MSRSVHPASPTRRRGVLSLALVAGLAVAAVACGSDSTTDDAVAEAEPAGATATPDTLEVVATDFEFGGLPDAVPVGTEVVFVNDAGRELHELVAVRLADTETRSAGELMADPAALGAVMGGGEPAMVLLAEPGGEQIVAVGDGTFTEPGRYLLVCAIPTGADPAEYLAAAAASTGGPPQVAGGAPHFAHGMFAELEVVAS